MFDSVSEGASMDADWRSLEISTLLISWFPLNENKVTTPKHLSNITHKSIKIGSSTLSSAQLILVSSRHSDFQSSF